jgi:predicted DNA-binding transcriptional regulator YafY
VSRSAERIVSLLWLLLEAGANGRTKAEIFSYLYDHLNTSSAAKQRQFSRDKEVLTSIGVPIEWQQTTSSDGTYRIDHDRLYLPDLSLTDAEVMALHQARALWMKTPIEDAIHTALARMTASRPMTPPVVGAQLGAAHNLLTDLVAAAREQSPIKFRYRTAGDDAITQRNVRPWAILMAHQQWYLVGWDFDRDDERIFKLTRIESKTISPLAAEAISARQQSASMRPPDFDINAIRQRLYTEQSQTDAYIWLDAEAASGLRVRATLIDERNGWELLQVTYQDTLKTAASIAALATQAQVDHERSPDLAQLVADILAIVRDAHAGTSSFNVPALRKVARTRRRTGDKDVIARRLGLVAVVNQHGGSIARAELRQRFDIDDATLTEDLQAMQFWGMPETDFAGDQFELDPFADPVEIANAELLAQPWQLSAPEALGLISGLSAVPTIPGISPRQRAAARALEHKLRDAIDVVAPPVGTPDPVVHPDLSLGQDDEVAETLHQAAQDHRVVSMSYYSESSGAISTRAIEPLQLLYSSGHGYVRAWCRKTESIRTFRLDRIGAATVTEEHFTPARTGPSADSLAPTTDNESLTVVVHATHRYRDVIGAYHPVATAVADDGSIFAQLAFRNLAILIELLTTHPGQIVVVEPAEVRAEIWQLTNQALNARYESTR